MASSGSGTGTPIVAATPSISTPAVTSGCDGRYAEAWEYTAFWCTGTLLIGSHDGVGATDAALSDADATFKSDGALINSGMILYNLTAGTSGEVTAVTETTLTATGVTWDALDVYRIVPMTGKQIAKLNHQLDTTAANIHAALGAVGACDCTFASWVPEYLAKLNIIETGIFHRCPCSRTISAEDSATWLEWMNEQLRMIREGEIELCAGHTVKGFPAVGWAEQSVTAFNAARIIDNARRRNS